MIQSNQILKHLKRIPIFPIQALTDYVCFRLAARINDLRNDGYNIYTDTVEKNGKRFAQYRLAPRKRPILLLSSGKPIH